MEVSINSIRDIFSLSFKPSQEHEAYKQEVKERIELFKARVNPNSHFVDIGEINARPEMIGVRSIMLNEYATGRIESMLVSIGHEQIWHNKWLTDSMFINHYHSCYIEKIHVLDGVYEVSLYSNEGILEEIVKLTPSDREFIIQPMKRHGLFARAHTKVITKFEHVKTRVPL